MYVAVVLFLAVGAINSQNNLLFAALGLGIGGLLVSGVLSGAVLMGVRASREPAPLARAGEPVEIHYHIRNGSRFLPAFGLRVEEEGARYEHAEPVRCSAFLTHVRVRSVASVSARLTPSHRGIIHLPAVRVWTTFPFGLTKKSVSLAQDDTLLVLPRVHELQPGILESVRSRAATGTGARPSPGASDDFYGVREYVAGDSLRRVAWRASARTGTLVVRQNSSPAPTRIWVQIAAAPGAAPESVENAVSLAASLLAQGERSGFAMGLATEDGALLHPPRLGRPHLHRLLTDLATWIPGDREAATSAGAQRAGAIFLVHAGPPPTGAATPQTRLIAADDLARLIVASESRP